MAVDDSAVSEYWSYLALEELLTAQRTRSEEHDETLFIVVHQVYELWFKLLLHELERLQRLLARGEGGAASQALRRCARVLRVVLAPLEVLDTLTARQFSGFRTKLGNGSGAQSAQFRQIEAALGRREPRVLDLYPDRSPERTGIEAAMRRPSVFDSLLRYLADRGYAIPVDRLHRDVSLPFEPSEPLRDVLLRVYLDDNTGSQLCEQLLEIDQSLQEWRYRHMSMAARLIGGKPGTGGTSGVSHLRDTLFRPMFPDLWAIRSQL